MALLTTNNWFTGGNIGGTIPSPKITDVPGDTSASAQAPAPQPNSSTWDVPISGAAGSNITLNPQGNATTPAATANPKPGEQTTTAPTTTSPASTLPANFGIAATPGGRLTIGGKTYLANTGQWTEAPAGTAPGGSAGAQTNIPQAPAGQNGMDLSFFGGVSPYAQTGTFATVNPDLSPGDPWQPGAGAMGNALTPDAAARIAALFPGARLVQQNPAATTGFSPLPYTQYGLDLGYGDIQDPGWIVRAIMNGATPADIQARMQAGLQPPLGVGAGPKEFAGGVREWLGTDRLGPGNLPAGAVLSQGAAGAPGVVPGTPLFTGFAGEPQAGMPAVGALPQAPAPNSPAAAVANPVNIMELIAMLGRQGRTTTQNPYPNTMYYPQTEPNYRPGPVGAVSQNPFNFGGAAGLGSRQQIDPLLQYLLSIFGGRLG